MHLDKNVKELVEIGLNDFELLRRIESLHFGILNVDGVFAV